MFSAVTTFLGNVAKPTDECKTYDNDIDQMVYDGGTGISSRGIATVNRHSQLRWKRTASNGVRLLTVMTSEREMASPPTPFPLLVV